MKLPESWREVRFGNVLRRVDRKVDPQTSEELTHFYVGLEHIESHTGRLLRDSREVTEGGDILSIKTAFQKGDILYGKLRPNLNKVHLAEQDGICSTDIWSLRASSEILPEFAAHYLRSPAIYIRTTQIAVGANLPRVPADAFDRIPIALPTLHEQQRIVDVLRQAYALGEYRSGTKATIDALAREFFAKLFGDVFGNEKSWPTRKLGQVSEIVRGSSPRPQGDPRLYGGSVPRLMVSDLTRDGLWVDAITDSLTTEGAKSSRPMSAQSVIMAVSGAPGLTAILNHDACIHDGFVGLRDLSAELLPEFVAFTLNLLRAKNDQQAVGAVFRNLTSDQVKAIVIPLPPLDLQKRFQSVLLQVKRIQQDIAAATEQLQEISAATRVEAFTGRLTASWREQHREEITQAVQRRDALHRERGAELTRAEPVAPVLIEPEAEPTNRAWLHAELSEFQRAVLEAFLAYPNHPLFSEDTVRFEAFCSDEGVVRRLADFDYSPNRIGRTLSLLADLGLIKQISLPRTNPLSSVLEYIKAFRSLRVEDRRRAADVALLRKTSRDASSTVTYFFEVVLDYETSEHAGAGGMFQVASLTDKEGRSRVELVDQGKHYTSLEEIKADVARALSVAADQVVLEEV